MSLKLVLLLWFMAPIQLNGTDLVFEKVSKKFFFYVGSWLLCLIRNFNISFGWCSKKLLKIDIQTRLIFDVLQQVEFWFPKRNFLFRKILLISFIVWIQIAYIIIFAILQFWHVFNLISHILIESTDEEVRGFRSTTAWTCFNLWLDFLAFCTFECLVDKFNWIFFDFLLFDSCTIFVNILNCFFHLWARKKYKSFSQTRKIESSFIKNYFFIKSQNRIIVNSLEKPALSITQIYDFFKHLTEYLKENEVELVSHKKRAKIRDGFSMLVSSNCVF